MKRLLLLGACVSITACSGHIASTQISELDDVRAMIQKSKAAGAEKCAPALQAKAVATMYQAAHEITDEVGSHPDEDAELVASALDHAKKAYAKAKKGCAPEVIALQGVFFENNSADLTASSTATLDHAVAVLKERASIAVEVAAHTDSRGKDSYNLDLSNRRAASVKGYLIAHGIAANRLTSKGYGEAQPRADNATVAGRAKNRRVELRIK